MEKIEGTLKKLSKEEYQALTIPYLQWEKKSLTKNFGELVAQPLEPGFGITLGNALRRVLLGAVEGAAVTSVIVKGVNNEFSTLPGIVEDVMQILLNIKEIVVRSKDGRPGKMKLQVTDEAVAKAGDIVCDENLEIVNASHIVAHVAPGGSIDIEFFVECGRGYQPAPWPIGQALQEDGRIYLDSMFSPVMKVLFDIEKTRVGQEIDYDKLILKIHTNGSEDPVSVLHYSVSVLRTQLEHFLLSSEIPFNDISAPPAKEEVEAVEEEVELGLPESISPEFLLKPIDELELSARAHNCLISAGIKRVIDLVNLSEDDVLKIKNFGRKSLGEVKDSMKAFAISFGMNIRESDLKKSLKGYGSEPVSE